MASDARGLPLYCQGNGGVSLGLWSLRALLASGCLRTSESMKFANKYELFEPVTTGRVETFVAKDLASGERVLLHIFEAPENRPDPPSLQWVLESFRKVAPNPPGSVLDTGRYSGTTYVYLATKLPDSADVQRWAQSYESYVLETQEISIPPELGAPAKPATNKNLGPLNQPPAQAPQTPSPKPPGDFTAAFLGLASPPKPRPEAHSSAAKDTEGFNFGSETPAPKREPGDFTRQFFSGPHEAQTFAARPPAELSEEKSVPPRGDVPRVSPEVQQTRKREGVEFPQKPGGAPVSVTAPSPDPGSFTALFRSSFKSEPNAPSESVGSPGKSDQANAGDFTDFFRGPFDGGRPQAETPNILPQAIDTPQAPAPGEFTRVFGSAKDGPFAAPPLQSSAENTPSEGGAFTQLFRTASQPAAPPLTSAPMQTLEFTAPKSEAPSSKEPAWTPPAPLPPKPSIEPVPRPTIAGPPQPAGATHVLSSAGGLPISIPPPLHAGPSEYTRIISGGMSGSEPPTFKVPSTAPVPAIPKLAVPPPPKFAPPAAVPIPKPKPSYLPLIIILNVLLFVAILLIVYFAMKH